MLSEVFVLGFEALACMFRSGQQAQSVPEPGEKQHTAALVQSVTPHQHNKGLGPGWKKAAAPWPGVS